MPPSGCSALLRTAAQLQCAAPARAEQRLLSLLLAHAAPVAGAGGGRARLSGPAAPRCLSALPCAHGALALAPRGFAGSAAAHAPPPRVSEPPPPSARFPSPSAAPAVPSDHEVTVKAFYVAQRIDLGALARLYDSHPRSQHRDSLIVSLQEDGQPGSVFATVAVTGYGSVVFFDVTGSAREAFLEKAKGCAVKLLPSPCVDDLRVAVRPSLPAWSHLQGDTLALRELDAGSLRVVSSVLAQSVALAHFETKVDLMLDVFATLNADLEATGGAVKLPRERLFQLVAENNNVLTDVITKLGLLSRSDAAWAAAQYHEVFSQLKEDFELDDRFENLHFKLELIGKQLTFNLEILQNRKSDSLEWIIIALISVEILVSLAHLYH